jgi:imidazole glycerol-phosphate synthase subunit HisH
VIAVVDYGVGNLASVLLGLERAGADAVITSDAITIQRAAGVVLPGVGAFAEGMDQLERRGLVLPLLQVIAVGRPFLGICLGMQLLFQTSTEMGHHDGLGVFPGRVVRFHDAPGRKVPHMGWNQLHLTRPSALLADVQEGDFAYFVHSYYVEPIRPEITVATTSYGLDFASVVERGSVCGVQFHPEKSQLVGATILKNFVMLTT